MRETADYSVSVSGVRKQRDRGCLGLVAVQRKYWFGTLLAMRIVGSSGGELFVLFVVAQIER